MSRRAYSLTEVLIAAGVSSVILAALFAALAHVSRGWRRTDATLERSQVAQHILDRLTDDMAHTDGVAHPTPEMLRIGGYPSDDVAFRKVPRALAHIVNRYVLHQIAPTHSLEVFFHEIDDVDPKTNNAGPDVDKCTFDSSISGSVKMALPPWLTTRMVILVKEPEKNPAAIYLSLALGRGVEDDQVLWVFVRKPHAGHPAGTVLRISEREGELNLTEKTPLIGDVDVRDQWLWLSRPPKYEDGEAFELFLRVVLVAPENKNLPGDQGFTTRRTITAGM